MAAKSFIGGAEEAARHFYATVVRGEVSDEHVRAYLAAATQIEEVWGQTDATLGELRAQGMAPWTAYERLGYALAFSRAARTQQVFATQLLAADAAADPPTRGYLPRITFDQANALCHHIQPNLQRAVAALNDPVYEPEVALPLRLGPRVEGDGACPITHLQGMIAAGREVREWTAGLVAQFGNEVASCGELVPAEVETHLAALRSRLAQGESALRFGTDLVSQVFAQRHAAPDLHGQAEDALWKALRAFFLVDQAVGLPRLLQEDARGGSRGSHTGMGPPHAHFRDRHVSPHDLWKIADPSARAELQGTEFGAQAMAEVCQKMGHVLSAAAQEYLHEVDYAAERGDAYVVAAMATCPFEPVYRARRNLTIAGARIPAGHEFHWNFPQGHVESVAHFGRSSDWQQAAR